MATQILPPAVLSLGDQPPNVNEANNQTTTKGGISAALEIQGYLKAPPARRDVIKADLKILSDDLTSIECDFNDVTTSMMQLDDKNILSVPFTPDWKSLHDKYTAHMCASQRIAADISYELQNFLTVRVKILRSEKVLLKKKKSYLTKYIEKLELFIDTARENSTNFLRLRYDILRFKRKLLGEIRMEDLMDKQLEEIDMMYGQFASYMPASTGNLEGTFRKELVEVYVVEVDDLGLVMKRLHDKLGGIENIWKLLRNDAEALLRKLSDMKEAEHNFEFDVILDTMEAVYLELKESLDDFALAVPESTKAE